MHRTRHQALWQNDDKCRHHTTMTNVTIIQQWQMSPSYNNDKCHHHTTVTNVAIIQRWQFAIIQRWKISSEIFKMTIDATALNDDHTQVLTSRVARLSHGELPFRWSVTVSSRKSRFSSKTLSSLSDDPFELSSDRSDKVLSRDMCSCLQSEANKQLWLVENRGANKLIGWEQGRGCVGWNLSHRRSFV